MSDYLRISHLFAAQINRGVFSHRSPRLTQLVSDVEQYIAHPDRDRLLAVKHSFDTWRTQDPKEFADRTKYDGGNWIDNFMQELDAAAVRFDVDFGEERPAETNFEFSVGPAAVRNRHQHEPYWGNEHFGDVLWPQEINNHSAVKKGALGGMAAADKGISVAQFAVGQPGIVGLAATGAAVTSATGVGLIAGSVALALIQSGLAVRSWQKTSRHLEALHYLQDHKDDEILSDCQVYASGGHPSRQAHQLVAHNILDYIIQQKSSKLGKKAVSVVPLLGSAIVSVGTIGRNIGSRLSGTLGVNRYKAAHWLAAHFCECQCLLTDCIVATLYSVEEMITLHRLYGYEETADLLAAKMKSI